MYSDCFWNTMNYYLGFAINPTKARHHTRPHGENKLRCPKNVVTNILFETNIKRGFHKLYSK